MYYGGGIAEAISIPALYFFKHLLNSEIPFKNLLDEIREKEYNGKGFVTLFVQATKVKNSA
jgi:hypothetical protein